MIRQASRSPQRPSLAALISFSISAGVRYSRLRISSFATRPGATCRKMLLGSTCSPVSSQGWIYHIFAGLIRLCRRVKLVGATRRGCSTRSQLWSGQPVVQTNQQSAEDTQQDNHEEPYQRCVHAPLAGSIVTRLFHRLQPGRPEFSAASPVSFSPWLIQMTSVGFSPTRTDDLEERYR